MTNNVGNAIKELRLKRSLSQATIAKLAGLTQPQLSKIESGSSDPQFTTVLQIADAMGVSILDIAEKVMVAQLRIQKEKALDNINPLRSKVFQNRTQ